MPFGLFPWGWYQDVRCWRDTVALPAIRVGWWLIRHG